MFRINADNLVAIRQPQAGQSALKKNSLLESSIATATHFLTEMLLMIPVLPTKSGSSCVSRMRTSISVLSQSAPPLSATKTRKLMRKAASDLKNAPFYPSEFPSFPVSLANVQLVMDPLRTSVAMERIQQDLESVDNLKYENGCSNAKNEENGHAYRKSQLAMAAHTAQKDSALAAFGTDLVRVRNTCRSLTGCTDRLNSVSNVWCFRIKQSRINLPIGVSAT